ncbi:MAG: hypothetical protein HRU09_18415 [Oligoflexales bacterium]|nr:hypothetical protein [Oligoflexales bacterium]
MADFSQDAAGNPGHPLAVAVSLPESMKIRENLLRILTDDRLTYGHNIKLPEQNQLNPIRRSLTDDVVKGLLEIQATKVDPLAFRTTLRYVTASNFGRLENKDPALSNEPPYYALTLYTDGAVVKDQYWSRLLEQLLVQADHYTKKYRVTGYDNIGNSVTFDLMERFYLHPTVKNQLKDKKFSERFGAEFIRQVQFTFASKVIPDVVAEYDEFREATNETTGGEYEIFNIEDVKHDIIQFFKILDMISALSVNFNRFALDKAAQDEHLKLLKLARFMALPESSNDEAQIFAVYKR